MLKGCTTKQLQIPKVSLYLILPWPNMKAWKHISKCSAESTITLNITKLEEKDTRRHIWCIWSRTHHYALVSTTHSKGIINNQKPKKHKRSVSAGFGTDVARISNLLFPRKGQSNTVLLSSPFQHLQSATARTVFHTSLQGAFRRGIEQSASYEIVKHFPAFLMPESRLLPNFCARVRSFRKFM